MLHLYKLNNYNIVLDVYSGSVHSVDDLTYDILSLYENTPQDEITKKMLEKYKEDKTVTKEELQNIYDEIEILRKNEKLFTPDKYFDVAGTLKNIHNEIKALCLHVAHTCNLNCEYCFASQGNYKGERSLMSFETSKRAIDFLIEHSGTRHNLEVDFFGGEPLLNFDVVKKTVEYCRSIEKKFNKNFRFTLTTNGLLLNDEVIDFCNKEMQNVVLSLDGRKETHDRFRKTITGKGSYDIIVPKFQKFVKARKGKSYYVRSTFTHFNPDFTNDLKHMVDLGFREISFEPVVCDPSSPYALTESDLKIVKKEYENLALYMLDLEKKGTPITFYHYMLDLKNGPCLYKRLSGCGSGSEYMAVTPTGDLYPCHQFVNNKDFYLGNVFTGIKNKDLINSFKSCNVYSRKDCQNCFAKLYCSGGCAANSYNATGSILGVYKPSCELFKKRIECAIMMQVAKLEDY